MSEEEGKIVEFVMTDEDKQQRIGISICMY